MKNLAILLTGGTLASLHHDPKTQIICIVGLAAVLLAWGFKWVLINLVEASLEPAEL